jgi:hypothetical protein
VNRQPSPREILNPAPIDLQFNDHKAAYCLPMNRRSKKPNHRHRRLCAPAAMPLDRW